VDVGVPGGEHGNVQIGGGDRVSTISLLGCSTSVALATGPSDEEEVYSRKLEISQKLFSSLYHAIEQDIGVIRPTICTRVSLF
jgi:hypothetical protein